MILNWIILFFATIGVLTTIVGFIAVWAFISDSREERQLRAPIQKPRKERA